jgi:hypothetical protein
LEMGVSQTIYSGWPRTMILLISVSHVARITGMSHWYLALVISFEHTFSPSASLPNCNAARGPHHTPKLHWAFQPLESLHYTCVRHSIIATQTTLRQSASNL